MNVKRLAFTLSSGVVVVFDQLGKLYASRTLAEGERVPLVDGMLSLTHAPHAGGAFGLLRDWTPTAQLGVFAFLALAVMVVVVSFYRGLAPGERASAAALGAILGGVISNSIDRLRYGSGLDFLHLGSPAANALADFNLADIAIILGVVTLVVELLASEMATRASERPRK